MGTNQDVEDAIIKPMRAMFPPPLHLRHDADAERLALDTYRRGLARFGRFFLILATHGRHRFFEEEENVIRDVRRFPIKFGGYSISFRGGHASVRIEPTEYKMIKAYFLQFAAHRSGGWLETEFAKLSYQPYAPVRLQLNSIRRAVNRARRLAGYEEVPRSRISGKRKVVRPFEQTPFANGSFRETSLVCPGTNGFVDLGPEIGDEPDFSPEPPTA